MNAGTVTEVAQLLELYERFGDEPYGEDVTQTAHALQCAALAASSGATRAMVAAALLHDVGHLLGGTRRPDWRDDVDDDRHEAIGARTLATLFGPSVAAPVALHVLAKRWRCTTDPTYVSGLSRTSRASLLAQGGELSGAERARFEAHPSFDDAVALRGWDDLAKDPEASPGSIGAFRDLLDELAAEPSS
jgi:predicted HD phosphohydrolase